MGGLWVPPGTMRRTRAAPAPAERWRELPKDDAMRQLEAMGSRGVRAYLRGPVQVLVAREPLGLDGALEWHLSISTPDRYPTWDEVADARYDLLPDDLTMAMLLPPRGEYVNRHPWCFHLHQVPGDTGRPS